MHAFTAVVLVLLLIAPRPLAAANQVELRWSELETFIVRGHVIVVQRDGATAEGKTIAVAPDSLVIQTKKGRTMIPRESIAALSLRETKGTMGRVLTTLAFVFVAMGVLGYVGAQADPEGSNAALGVAVLGGITAAGFGGYYLGRSFDRKTTVIRILPD